MKKDPKTTYAQSSDIKSRTYLEYRRDMKRKAIAELDARNWIEKKLKEMNPGKKVAVRKSGGDAFLWFLKKGGVTREPDYVAEIGKEALEIEFQYAGRKDLIFYDFKVSKVARKVGDKCHPIETKLFVYIHKPLLRYAIFKPDWIMKNGQYGMVEAWRSHTFKVPAESFKKILVPDKNLAFLCKLIDLKNLILEFQHELLAVTRQELSHLLQGMVDRLRQCAKDDGSYFSSKNVSPLAETRYALFAINLLEDMTQDAIHYYSVNLSPIKKIYENVRDAEKTYESIKGE